MRVAFACLLLAVPGPLAAAPTLCPAATQSIDSIARRTLASGTPGMIVEVAQDGEPMFVGTYGMANLEQGSPVRRDSVFKYASVTKQFTAALILILAEEGKLGLDHEVTRYIPEFGVGRGITIRDLLQHTSGIPDYAGVDEKTYPPGVAVTPDDMLRRAIRLMDKPEFEPGTKWAYSNSNYVLLGIIAERTGGAPIAELFAARLFGKAGTQSIVFDDPRDVVPGRVAGYRKARKPRLGFENAQWVHPTIPGAAGGLRGTAHDLVKWTDALFKNRVLKPESLAALIAPGKLRDGRTTKFGMPIDWQKGLDSDYGFGLFVKQTPAGVRLGHSGDISGFSSWLAHYPRSGVTIVQIVNSESVNMPTDDIEAAVFSSSSGTLCRG